MPRGRPKTDHAEILRRKIWYYNVVKRSGMSDYELDGAFDLIKNRSGKHRRRFFERLRAFNEMPFRGRTIEFVDLVDSHNKLNGTAKLYTSPFWELTSTNILSIERLRQLVIVGFRQLDLLSKPGNHIDSESTLSDVLLMFLTHGNLTTPNIEAYIKTYDSLFLNLETTLDSLAITAALYREAYYATNLRIALFLEGAFFNQLESIKEASWMPNEILNDFSTLASERILRVSNSPQTLPKEYLELFNDAENKKSPAGIFLAKHDGLMGW